MERKSVHSTGMGSFVEYETDSTTFIVGRRFAPVGEGPTLKEAFEKLFTHNFVDWTAYDEEFTMEDEKLYPAVGKEDYEAD